MDILIFCVLTIIDEHDAKFSIAIVRTNYLKYAHVGDNNVDESAHAQDEIT